MDPSKLLEQIKDAESFLVFARALATDRASSFAKEKTNPSSPYGSDVNGWNNTTIESFLEGAISWAEDSDFGITQGLDQANPWRQFAAFLYCGKIYE
jgi:hypothetical protein